MEPPSGEASESNDSEASESNVAGTLERDAPLEPQEIALENAIFVALGAAFVIGFVIAGLAGL